MEFFLPRENVPSTVVEGSIPSVVESLFNVAGLQIGGTRVVPSFSELGQQGGRELGELLKIMLASTVSTTRGIRILMALHSALVAIRKFDADRRSKEGVQLPDNEGGQGSWL